MILGRRSIGNPIMKIHVTLSEQALQGMVLAACEAYVFGKNDDQEPVETYAHLWGFRRYQQENDTEYLHVDRVNICVSAQVRNDQAEVFTGVISLQDDIVKHWSPHLSLLGDFHTHPYDSLSDLKQEKGWNFSECDQSSFLSDENLWTRADGSPISLVMAITKLERVREGWAECNTSYRWRFDVGQYRFFVSVAAGRLDRNNQPYFSRRNVNLFLGQYFYNRLGNRVGDG